MTIAPLNPDEQAAWERLLEAFPDAVVGEVMPEPPDTLRTARALMNGGGLADGNGFVHELRVIGEVDGQRVTESGRFDTPGVLAHWAERCDGKANVYLSVNPCKFSATHLLKRGRATSDGTIARIRWLPIDYDAPDEPVALREHLAGLGFPEPFVGFSGHGWWLLYRVDQENTQEAAELRRRVLVALKSLYPAVDTTSYNASRIMRLFGTLNVKDPSAPVRSRVASAPFDFPVVPDELLEVVAGDQPVLSEPTPDQGTAGDKDLVLAKLAERGVVVTRKKAASKAPGTVYELTPCPFYPEKHHERASVLVAWADGKLHFECQGETCQRENHRILDLERLLGIREVAKKVGDRIVVWAEEIEVPPTETIWGTRILLHDLNAVVGREKAGKGLLLKRLGADLTTGELTGKPERILYMSPEESTGVQKEYLAYAGAVMDKRVALVPRGSFLFPDDIDELVQVMADMGIGFVLIDVLNKHMAERLDPDSKRDVALTLGTLAQATAEHRITVLLSLHLGRGKDGIAARDSWAHSMEWRRAMRSAVLIGQSEEDMRYERSVVHDFNNYRQTSLGLKYVVEYTSTLARLTLVREDPFLDAEDLFWTPRRVDGSTRAECADRIVSIWIQAGRPPAMPSSAFSTVGNAYSNSTVARARDQLGITVKTDSEGQSGLRHMWDFSGVTL